MSAAVFNDIEPYACAWMRNLIDAGHIARGEVIERSIVDLVPDDVRASSQFHAFAGIGVWSHALRLAGWPDDVTVWTGSCPCQPFSSAGKKGGLSDARHLWPEWFRLIKECRPPIVLGEQVASADGLTWLDAVQADMEAESYAFAAFDLCAAGVGAPHMRQRLYFVAVADADSGQCQWARTRGAQGRGQPPNGSDAGRVADNDNDGREVVRGFVSEDADTQPRLDADGCRAAGFVGDADGGRGGGDSAAAAAAQGACPGSGALPRRIGHESVPASATRGFWGGADWLLCRDPTGGSKWRYRPVEPGSFPLAHGAPARVGRVRAYGNAIVSEVAATFIRAVMGELASRGAA